ncbi:MAG: ABC transporter permease subunit [Spirochaeta sp.]
MKERIHKRRIGTVIRKDLREIGAAKMVLLPMIVVPVIMAVFLPAVIIVTVGVGGTDMMNGVEQIESLIPDYHFPESVTDLTHRLLYIFLNFTFLPLFLIIPLMVSSIIAANAVVGEKERGTLETLLYTPLTNREFIVGKLLGAFLPGALIAPLSFILYFGVGNTLSQLMFGLFLVGSPEWIPALLLLSPAVSLLGLSVTLLVSIKTRTFMEAQQISAMVVVPLVAMMIAQISGLIVLNMLYLVIVSVVTLLIDYVLITRLIPRFDREEIIARL